MIGYVYVYSTPRHVRVKDGVDVDVEIGINQSIDEIEIDPVWKDLFASFENFKFVLIESIEISNQSNEMKRMNE